MRKKTIHQVEVWGRRVLVRLDLNVPLTADGQVADDRRIRAALPTVKALLKAGGRLVLMSHLGRPARDGSDRDRLSLRPVAARLSDLLDADVPLVGPALDDTVVARVDALREGEALLLENLRFHQAEVIKDKDADRDKELHQEKEDFARFLAGLGDVFVNDAFGTCHRDNASMLTVPQCMAGRPRVVGDLVGRELDFLGTALREPARPFVCLIGGAKVSDKLGVIRSLVEKCEAIMIGGAMAYTFLAAQGIEVGRSLVEPQLFDTARDLLKIHGARLMLPTDSIAAKTIAADAENVHVTGAIPRDLMGVDIGPATVERFSKTIATAGTVIWNGPMGVFETPPFDEGTLGIALAMAAATGTGTVTIVGGGDSAAAVDKAGVGGSMSHISTGGGATIEFLEGRSFAALEVLDDADEQSDG